MTPAPIVSIAICTYNGAKYIGPLLQSIVGQSYNSLEIIIVDDCSRDGTFEILNTFQEADQRIKLYRNEQNLGYVKNFEKAIKLCAGEYIALCDQDDIWDKDKISIMVEEIKDNILIYHNSDFIDDEGQRIGTETIAAMRILYDGASCLPLLFSNCVHGHAVLFNKQLKEYMFPFDSRFTHDWWIAYVAFNTGSVKYIDKVLVHYRQHEDTITDTFKLRGEDAPKPRVKGIGLIDVDFELLEYCAAFKYNREPGLVKETYRLLSHLAKGEQRLKNYWFLLTYFDLLFYLRYKPKSFLSKVNLVRKICFQRT